MSAQPRILALFGARVIFGAERDNIEALVSLRAQGCEVLCLVRDEPWNRAIPEALASRGLASAQVPYIDGWLPGWRLHIVLRNPIAFVVGNWRFIKIVREFGPTHIHAFNPLYILSFLAGLTLVRTPMVYRSVDRPIRHRAMWRLLWRFIIWRAQRFVAISRFIAHELELTGVKADRIEVIYGKPPARLSQTEAPVLPAFDAAMQDIIFVGQINKHKGPDILVRAFGKVAAKWPQARLLIVGRISEWKGDEWARELRDSVAHDPNLSSRVFFVGFVEDVPSLLQGRTILVAPTLTEEPLGLVVMEAKAAGLPSVVFPSGGLPEMIEHNIDGFICREKSVEELTEALDFYLADPSIAPRQGAAAKLSLRRLGIDEFANHWLAAYERANRCVSKVRSGYGIGTLFL
jgi:glycosyltransferase involved in cell wall biosynthesis